jgi:cation diffusion facilitator family transporter
MKNIKIEKRAPIVAIFVALFLVLIKFFVWIISGSVTLLSSAIDSLFDSLVSIFNYFAIKFSLEPADEEHSYWHGKIEGIAAIIQGTIIILTWLYIIYMWVEKIIIPEPILYIKWTILVIVISIIATWALVYFLNHVYKKTNNLVIKWDSIHYKMDLLTNLAILLVLIILFFFPSLSFIDWIAWILIWLYIIYEAYWLVKKWIYLLLDKILEEHDDVKKVIEKYVEKKKIDSYHCLKTRSWWSHIKFVEFHFVMNPKTTILDSHNIWDKIEEDIKKINKEAYWHIVWHVDPYDDSSLNDCKIVY